MRFKHSLQVFIDNIATTYKLLLYRIIVVAIIAALACAVIIPTQSVVSSTAEYTALSASLKEFWANLSALHMTALEGSLNNLKAATSSFIAMMNEQGLIAIDIVCFVVLVFIYNFLTYIGDYCLGEILNNRMSLGAHTPFSGTLLKDFGRASLYSIIYTPIAMAFYALGALLIWAIVFKALAFTPILLKLFIAASMAIVIFALKFSLTTDWMPHLLHTGCGNGKAILYCLKPQKGAFVRVLSTLIFMTIVIFVLNVVCAIFTFGAALIITIPAGAMLLTCYQFVNYRDNNSLKYFIDDYSIIGPQKDTKITLEQFFNVEQ